MADYNLYYGVYYIWKIGSIADGISILAKRFQTALKAKEYADALEQEYCGKVSVFVRRDW